MNAVLLVAPDPASTALEYSSACADYYALHPEGSAKSEVVRCFPDASNVTNRFGSPAVTFLPPQYKEGYTADLLVVEGSGEVAFCIELKSRGEDSTSRDIREPNVAQLLLSVGRRYGAEVVRRLRDIQRLQGEWRKEPDCRAPSEQALVDAANFLLELPNGTKRPSAIRVGIDGELSLEWWGNGYWLSASFFGTGTYDSGILDPEDNPIGGQEDIEVTDVSEFSEYLPYTWE